MSQDNEQFRAGFEAWLLTKWGNDANWILTRSDNGQYKNWAIREKFETWIAAKRDASTEPSESAEYPASEYQPGQWWLAELEKHWGHGESSNDTKRAAKVACNFAAAVFAERVAGTLKEKE